SRSRTGATSVLMRRTTSAVPSLEPSTTTRTSAVQRRAPRYARMRSSVGSIRCSSLYAGMMTLSSTRQGTLALPGDGGNRASPAAHRRQLPGGEHTVHAAHEPVLVEVEADHTSRRVARLDGAEVDHERREAVQHPDGEPRVGPAQLGEAAIHVA